MLVIVCLHPFNKRLKVGLESGVISKVRDLSSSFYKLLHEQSAVSQPLSALDPLGLTPSRDAGDELGRDCDRLRGIPPRLHGGERRVEGSRSAVRGARG